MGLYVANGIALDCLGLSKKSIDLT
jgi:hypothetical protein